jgi:hypothetical protein
MFGLPRNIDASGLIAASALMRYSTDVLQNVAAVRRW